VQTLGPPYSRWRAITRKPKRQTNTTNEGYEPSHLPRSDVRSPSVWMASREPQCGWWGGFRACGSPAMPWLFASSITVLLHHALFLLGLFRAFACHTVLLHTQDHDGAHWLLIMSAARPCLPAVCSESGVLVMPPLIFWVLNTRIPQPSYVPRPDSG